ncbi:cell division protein FtsA [Spirochaeta cellobiosiphila]|uniref:cell division protein FtsA n=1 Tax=Spirochaeta cellobiosiphila TaxID=504483 RepID=UPI000421DAB0|nr:cell division protein FtsA [Spirochaeta cellobiosiphila]
MASDDLIVGLDIGTSKVTAIIAERNYDGDIDIIGIGQTKSTGLRRGVVINIEATLKSVSEAIEEAEQMAGRDVYEVVTCLAGGAIEGINSRGVVAITGKGREISEEDISRVIDAAKAVVIPMDREVLHVIPQEFIVDDQRGIKDPLNMIGIRLESEVHIITGSVSSSQNLIRCVNRAGFKVNEIILESIAVSRSVLNKDEREMGVLLIDLGGGTTDIMVYMDGAPFHSSLISIGGDQVTSDLSYGLKIPPEEAERIKIQSGICYFPLVEEGSEVILPALGSRPATYIPKQTICEIIQPRMEEIFSMVREQILRKNYHNRLGGGIVLTGGGALLSGAVELAQEMFGLPVRIGLPFKLHGLSDEYSTPDMATAIGLVQYTWDKKKSELGEVLPKREIEYPFWSKLKRWLKEFI